MPTFVRAGIPPFQPAPAAPTPSLPAFLPAVRGIKTIHLEVLIDAANPPIPTGPAYLWYIVRKLLGFDREVGFEDLLSPVPGTQGRCRSERSLLWTIKSRVWSIWPWREAAPLPCGRWEDIHFWYGTMEV
jgi:hypothetical protein